MAKFLFFDYKVINLLLEEEHPSGGAAVQTLGWIHGMLANDQEVKVITDFRDGDVLKEEYREVEVIPGFDPSKGIRWFRWFTHRFPYIYQKIKEAKPDYVYESIPNWGSFFTGTMCKMLGVKYILRISNDYLLDERILRDYSRVEKTFLRLGLRMADWVLCQNDYQYKVLKADFPNQKVLKIGNPIKAAFATDPVPYERRSYIGWVGLFQHQKNLKLLFEVASKLPQEKFVVAGSNEPSKMDGETKEYLAKLKQLDNVEFAGFLPRKEVLPFLSNAKYLLNTSHYEGFSNTFLEAMAVGTPILTSTKVNPDEIISKYQLGVVYTEAGDLAAKVENLGELDHRTMSQNALDYVKQNHESTRLAKKLKDALEGVEATPLEKELEELDLQVADK